VDPAWRGPVREPLEGRHDPAPAGRPVVIASARQAELLAPPRARGVLRDEVVAEQKIVYLRNVGQGSSGLEGEACSTRAMSSPRRSGTAPR
jgi:hypothetical protein